MKVKQVTEIQSLRVETDEEECFDYTRYSADSWWVSMGGSEEEVYDCTEIEQAYQDYIAINMQKEVRPEKCADCYYYVDMVETGPPEYYCNKLKRFKMNAELAPPGDCPLEKL